MGERRQRFNFGAELPDPVPHPIALQGRAAVDDDAPRQVDQCVDGQAQPHHHGPDTAALLCQRRVGNRPALSRRPDHRVRRHLDVVEEHLVEVGGSGQFAQRPDRDARRGHIQDESADALVLGRVGIGAGQQIAEVGPVAVGGPHLLAGHDVAVGTANRPSAKCRQVAARARFAEELAPELASRTDFGQM